MKVRKELFDEKCFLEFFEQLNKEKGFPDYFHVDWISFVVFFISKELDFFEYFRSNLLGMLFCTACSEL